MKIIEILRKKKTKKKANFVQVALLAEVITQ